MNKYVLLVIGVLIGLALPFMVDFVLFGDFTPCEVFKTYEDGSTILVCSVRG